MNYRIHLLGGKNMKKSIKFIIVLLILMFIFKDNKIVKADSSQTFTVDGYQYTVTNKTKKTVKFIGLQDGISTKEIVIPESVTYGNKIYTVTSVYVEGCSKNSDKVKSIIVPKSLKGEFIITASKEQIKKSTEFDNLDVSVLDIPYINLEKVTFLGTVAPSKISIMIDLKEKPLDYYVPSQSEAAYEAVSCPNTKCMIDQYDMLDSDHTYKWLEIAPRIISESRPNPEATLFATEYGLYQVIESAVGRKGKVALLNSKKLIPVLADETPNEYDEYNGEYTLESEVNYGEYQYSVTKLAKNAIHWSIKGEILTIPDTITQMDDHAINAYCTKAIFFSKNCKTIPSKLFICGEEAKDICFMYIPNTVSKIEKDAFQGVKAQYIFVPQNATYSASELKKYGTVIVTNKKKEIVSNGIKVADKFNVQISKNKSVNACCYNKNATEKIWYISIDNSTFKVSNTGIITPKHKGEDYLVVLAENSGEHKSSKVVVKDMVFTNGIYTYRMNYDTNPTVTIIDCKPNSTMKKLIIPSTVTYKNKKYTVTQIVAGDSIITDKWLYTGEKGYSRTYDYAEPLIKNDIAKKLKVDEIVIPATVTLHVSYFGNLPKLKIIRFKGTKAPKSISTSYKMVKQVTFYIPKKSYANYKKMTYQIKDLEHGTTYTGWEKASGFQLKMY